MRECGLSAASYVLYCPLRPRSSSFQGAQGLTTGTELIAFHSSHLLLCFRYSARGITAWHCARTGSFRGLCCEVRLRVQDLIARSPESGCSSSWRYSTKRVLPEKHCGTERVPSERLARPIFQACTRIAVQPAAQVLVSLRVHLEQCSESRAERGPRTPAREILTRKK